MKYAVIRVSGHQYKVSEGEEVLVDKLTDLSAQAGKKVEPEILLVADEDKVKVGKPKVAGAKVSVKVLKDVEKGEKVEVVKYKAKSRYRRHIGFRPQYTRIKIEKISL